MDNSSFGKHTEFFKLTDITPLNTTGATSDTCKVRISGKWHFLKRPKKELADHPLYIAAFEKEFDLGYTLDHPHIVRYITKGRDNDGFYFLTEYVDGETLNDFIAHHPAYFQEKENVRKFIEQLLSALQYLHNRQILHLDLKPGNILITAIGHDVKIVDLGFAYSDCYQYLTVGKTNQYAAPEQLSGGAIDQRTDVYGVGMLLLYLFTQTSDKSLLHKIPQPYKSIIKKCLSEQKEHRFFDVVSIASAIKKESGKKKYYIIPTVVLLLLIVCAMGGVYWPKKILKADNDVREPVVSQITVDTIVAAHSPETFSQQERKDKEDFKEKEMIAGLPEKTITAPEATKPSAAIVCAMIQEKSQQELSKIYRFSEPVVYSLKDQISRISQTRELYKQLTDTVSSPDLLSQIYVLFWKEQDIVFAPYFQKQTLACLDLAKRQAIPDSINQKRTVYQLIDKETADLFIPFIQKHPQITSKDQEVELIRLKEKYEKRKMELYDQYQFLFTDKADFMKEYQKYESFTISHVDDWIKWEHRNP